MADGFLEWWKVEMRMASAWRWFMLTLNWSWSMRARSSHMLASASRRLSTACEFMK
uniref:HK2 n=1 Tax=Arundo donax TaxID=35708 RepID=A0A0A9HNR6_ARUDO